MRRRTALVLPALALAALGAALTASGDPTMHTSSPQWRQGRFRNPQPLWNDYVSAVKATFSFDANARPGKPLPVHRPAPEDLLGGGLRATWLGHSTVYLDIGGVRILTDPVWAERASPVGWAGPRRFHPAPVALEDLPLPHAVVLSHDHYDHLDLAAIRRMKDWPTRFFAPLGVDRRLEKAGIPRERITALDWWQSAQVEGLEILSVPARHASGRGLLDRDRTLWSGWVFRGPAHRVYFSGDTGMFDALERIADLGPFDLTLIECGQYGPAWPDWHMGPEQAVKAHRILGGRHLLPIHWGTFPLAPHAWTEPVERVLAEAARTGERVLTPRPGEPVLPGTTATARWWPALPWKRAEEAPIVSTPNGLRPQPARG
ncbi:MAG TPA: MBL fold metallo-hydrolase [Holophaga sp.]|nr:MBL fold metallo-hydrolase [Holophaga sp.]